MSRMRVPLDHIGSQELVIDLPLKSSVDIAELSEGLAIPGFVDKESFQMKKLIGILAATNLLSDLGTRYKLPDPEREEDPIVLAFGGAAFRLWSSSANDPSSAFHRNIGDIDVITRSRDWRVVLAILDATGEAFGSMFLHWVTEGDRRFNAFRAGKRFRVTGFSDIDEEGLPVIEKLDIVVDDLHFCHEIPTDDGFSAPRIHRYTVGLESLIISKAQYIREISEWEIPPEHEPRVIAPFGRGKVILTMEYKDIKDVGAALNDLEIGTEPYQINPGVIRKALERDWRLCKTVLLNLKHLRDEAGVWHAIGAKEGEIVVVREKLNHLCFDLEQDLCPKRPWYSIRKKWWDIVDETK